MKTGISTSSVAPRQPRHYSVDDKAKCVRIQNSPLSPHPQERKEKKKQTAKLEKYSGQQQQP